MKKISILDQFAADAINAPAVITGGGCDKGGSQAHKTGSKGGKGGSKSHKSGSHKSNKSGSHKSGSKSGGTCCCDPKLCWN